jgi:hypothetical protein
MDVGQVLTDLFGRVDEHVHGALTGIDPEAVNEAPEPASNTIGWLVWHLARQADAQLAELTGAAQVWMTGDWPARFGLSADPDNHGYGHTPAEVAAVQPDGVAALTGYYDAVSACISTFLEGVTEEALDRIVDDRWDPPVSLGVRLISVADDAIQHAAQAAYVRGLLDRR